MLKKCFLILLAFSFALALRAQTVDEIIDKSIKAYGGVDAYSKLNTIYTESLMNVKMAGMEVPMKTWTKKNGNITKIRLETQAMGQSMIMGFDGTKYWLNMGAGGQEVPDNMIDQIKGQINQGAGNVLHPLLDYKKSGLTAELQGKVEIDGKSLYKIRISKAKGEPTFYYLDAISYFIYRVDVIQSGQGQTMEVTSIMKENQKINGVIMPKFIESSVGGQVAVELTIQKVEINQPIDDSMFIMPKKN